MRRLLLAAALVFAPLVAAAEPATMTAEEAHRAHKAGEVVLIDIRTPEEWADGGMPEGAVPLTLQDPDINAKLNAILARAGDRPLALICRTGGRSGWLSAQLESAGLTNVIDVTEGVYGSAAGPGWIRRGLPVERPGPGTFDARLDALGGG